MNIKELKLLFILIIPFLSFGQGDLQKIKEVLYKQEGAWNQGDLHGFMLGYWNSENLIFTSEKHKPSYGWNNTLNLYKESYPTKESMGELKFQIFDIILTSNKTATLDGSWELIRKNDNPRGLFYLNIRKFNDTWLITKDSTTESSFIGNNYIETK